MIPPFTASIRWRSRWRSTTEDRWEIDTSCEGFPSVMDAVMWAMGLVPTGVAALHVTETNVWFELKNGQKVRVLAEQLSLWHGPSGEVIRDSEFELVARPNLSHVPWEARFAIRSFKIDAADGPLAVKVEAALDREKTLISIRRAKSVQEETDDLFDLVTRT